MVMNRKTHAALVHNHKCSRLWSCSPSLSNTGILSQPLSLQYEYHKYERQWFIITSVQGHGHVAQVPATQVHYHNFLDYSMDITNVQSYGHVARDSRNAGPWSQVRKAMAM